jgi:hypothetical protein
MAHKTPGVGATDTLHLRVSVAVLVRTLFHHPDSGERMLALERRFSLEGGTGGPATEVKSHPFGGALRITDLLPLQERLGNFHFDSQRSRAQQDFRLFIQPDTWPIVRAFCLEQFDRADGSSLEVDPGRELQEEFMDALGIDLRPNQYSARVVGTVVEDQPSATENVHARGYPTVRLYRIFEAWILDPVVISAMVKNSETYSDGDLRDLARKNPDGRTSTVLALPLGPLTAFYASVSSDMRNTPLRFQSHLLDETVPAILEGVEVPKYQRLGDSSHTLATPSSESPVP